MERVGRLIGIGMAGCIAGAAYLAPGVLQPARGTMELARLMIRAVDEMDAVWSAEGSTEHAEASAAQVVIPAPPRPIDAPAQVCLEPSLFEFQASSGKTTRFHLVVCKSAAGEGAESKWMLRDALKKS